MGVANPAAEINVYVPLQFFCNRNPGLALPLIALQYHDVRVDIEFNNVGANCTHTTGGTMSINTAQLMTEYIYLDSPQTLILIDPSALISSNIPFNNKLLFISILISSFKNNNFFLKFFLI